MPLRRTRHPPAKLNGSGPSGWQPPTCAAPDTSLPVRRPSKPSTCRAQPCPSFLCLGTSVVTSLAATCPEAALMMSRFWVGCLVFSHSKCVTASRKVLFRWELSPPPPSSCLRLDWQRFFASQLPFLFYQKDFYMKTGGTALGVCRSFAPPLTFSPHWHLA